MQPQSPPGPADSYNQPQPGLTPNSPEYDFIVNPGTPPPKRRLPGANSSLPVKIGLIFGGLIILLILLSFVRGIISPKPNLTPFITVAQDQQVLISLTTNANMQKDLTTTNMNFAGTAELSLKTAQADLLKYLRTNGKKLNGKTLNLKVSGKTNEQLAAAGAAANYNPVFQEVMNTKLSIYISDLKQALLQAKGKKGRALLDEDYKQAQLLLAQLGAPEQ